MPSVAGLATIDHIERITRKAGIHAGFSRVDGCILEPTGEVTSGPAAAPLADAK